jgi:hypothetical protein
MFCGGRRDCCPTRILKALCRWQPHALILVNPEAAVAHRAAVAGDLASHDAGNGRRYRTRRSRQRTIDLPRPASRGGRERDVGCGTSISSRAPRRSWEVVASFRSHTFGKDQEKFSARAIADRDDAYPWRVWSGHSKDRQGDRLGRGSLRRYVGRRDALGAPQSSGRETR